VPEPDASAPPTSLPDVADVGPHRTIGVVAHTHWDREWYHPAIRFQARLVALVDALLAAPIDPAQPFLLDGQASVVADYLAIRPERTSDIARALSAGALEAGPWFVLGDNLIPSGEAIVRNLEAGRRLLRRLGATPPRVAYCPDTFGHPAALPLIARGFGCETAIVWRGFGGRSHPPVDAFWWEGADGSRVLTYHLPPDGYEFGSALPADPAAMDGRWPRIRDVLGARNTTGMMLLTVGADHHAAAPDLASAVSSLRAAATHDGVVVQRTGLAQACGLLHQSVREQDAAGHPLPRVRGELRDSYGYTWTLQGTFATRAQQKRRNARLERTLLRDVEPWTALTWLHASPHARRVAADGSITLPQLPALLALAWETLLRAHPHDSLCGCSVDHVAADVDGRHRDVASLALELRQRSLALAVTHDHVDARTRPVHRDPPLVLRNRSARARDGLAELRVLETIADVGVGPTSGASPELEDAATLPSTMPRAALASLTWQRLGSRVRHVRRESPQHYPDTDLVREHRVLAWVPDVPASGLRVLNAHGAQVGARPVPPAVTAQERDGEVVVDNGHVRVTASHEGVQISTMGRTLVDALSLVTQADAGDSYTPSLRGDPESLQVLSVRLGATGPLRASVQVRWRWRAGAERIVVRTDLVLDAGAAAVRCHVRGHNRRKNHRVRLCWHTDVRDANASPALVMADAAFGPVKRTPVAVVPNAKPFEQPPPTCPLHRWLSACDATRGATLISDGLAEGEVHDGQLSVTLVRAIGELSRSDLPERPGHAGWPSRIPHAQSIGRFRARVALLLHGPWSDATHDLIDTEAEGVLTPLVGESWRELHSTTPEVIGPELEGDGLRASAICLGDDGNSVVLRAQNVRGATSLGAWLLPHGRWRARPCRMDGTPLGAWASVTDRIALHLLPHAVLTHEVARDDD